MKTTLEEFFNQYSSKESEQKEFEDFELTKKINETDRKWITNWYYESVNIESGTSNILKTFVPTTE